MMFQRFASLPALCVLMVTGLLCTATTRADLNIPVHPQQMLQTLRPEHPRLLANADDFARIRRLVETEERMKAWHAALLKQARSYEEKPLPPMHVEQGSTRVVLQGTGQLRNRMYLYGLLYQIHGQQQYVDLAWRDMQPALVLPDWNEQHFLGVAETTRALAIACDWLHAGLSDEQRQAIVAAVADKGLTAALRAYRGQSMHGWWPAVANNWNQVCNGGIGIGALAIADDRPELAADALWYATRLLPLAMRSYAPAGAWDEGLAYWSYGGDYNVQFIACLLSAMGTDFGLAELPGFAQTGYYPIHLTGPTGLGFNFGDAGGSLRIASPISLWLARRFDAPLMAKPYLDRPRGGEVLNLLWYDPDLAAKATEASFDTLPLTHHYTGVEIVTFRSQWQHPDALFLAIKGGSNKANHAHIDLGTFVLDALGQRWIVDMGTDSYDLPGYFKQQRWSYYRVRAESHNTLVINPDKGPGQHLSGVAKVIDKHLPADDFAGHVTIDLTDAYRSQKPAPRQVTRKASVTPRRQVILEDTIVAGDTTSPTQALWLVHTLAKVTLSSDSREALLSIKDKQMRVRIHQPAKVTFETAPAEPLPTSPNPSGQAPNRNITRLQIRLDEPLAAEGKVTLQVHFEPLWPAANEASASAKQEF